MKEIQQRGRAVSMTVMDEKVHAYKDQISHLEDQLPEVVHAYHRFTGECFQPAA